MANLDEMSRIIGNIEEKVDNIDRKLNSLCRDGCKKGETLERRISNHETQHKTAYVIVAAIAGVISWLMSIIAGK